MASDSEDYIAILKASYDYEPQSEDEIAIKEDQLLFLKERVDDDWWRVKVKPPSQEDDSPTGLVPAAYVEPAEHTSVVKALYDYEANAPGELSVKEDEILYVYETEEDWLLVQSQSDGGRAGFVPGNYVEIHTEGQALEASRIIIPPSPPPITSSYVDPADRVASTKIKADDIKTWSVSELDKKGKKKKGTLGVGNGAVFFASEADKTPVQKWQTSDVESITSEKAKHLKIEIGGPSPISLHFHAGSKDNAEAIKAKLESSKALSTSSPPTSPTLATASASNPRRVPPTLDAHKEAKKASVHFSSASPVIIPPREPSEEGEDDEAEQEEEEQGYKPAIGRAERSSSGEGEPATALYEFTAAGEDELSVAEGEPLVILEKDGDEWWKCRNTAGEEGVVPASYLEVAATTTRAVKRAVRAPSPEKEEEEDEDDTEAQAQAEADRLRKAQEAEKAKKKLDAQKRAKDAAIAAETERQRRKDAAASAASRLSPPPIVASPKAAEPKQESGTEGSVSSKRGSVDHPVPPSGQTRVWHDRTGQFRVEAVFLGFSNGKLRLHKVNGVTVEVPAEKMSTEDMRYVERLTSKKSRASTRQASDDDIPLAIANPGAANKAITPQPKKGPKIDWFDFFLSAGCDLDDCTRYATSFERDKIDENILPDITESTMRSLGLREGDIIRVTKAIEKRKPTDNLNKPSARAEEQLRKDEELARRLQAQETGSSGPSRSPAPNIFTGPGGVLKAPRRGRPQPTKSLPASVDMDALSSVSDKIQRTTSPQASSPITTPQTTSSQQPPRTNSALAASSGFEDDAWTNRSSSTKPQVGTPPISAPRTPSAPPITAATANTASSPIKPTPTVTAPKPQATATPNLAQTTESDIFNQLSRLSELRKSTPTSSTPPITATAVRPLMASNPPSFNSGLPINNSGVSIAQMQQQAQLQQAQQAQQQQEQLQRMQQQSLALPAVSPQPYNGPRGPFAPVPANQGLLAPLIPTHTTGMPQFIPTRPGSSISSPFQNPPLQQQSPFANPPMQSQQSPFQNTQPQQAFSSMPMNNGMLTAQPMMPMQTGMPFGGFNAGMQGQQNGGFVPQQPLQPTFTGFTTNNFNQSPFGNGMSPPPPVPPLPMSLPTSSTSTSTSPANIFAQMKSGTFANDGSSDSAPQSSDKYNALRPNGLIPQATGWNQSYQGGFTGYQH